MSKEVIIAYNKLFVALSEEGWNDDSIESLKEWRKIYDKEREEESFNDAT